MGYRQLEHTADLALEIWASDEPHLLVEGARAIVETIIEQTPEPGRLHRRVSLEAIDAEDRLVRWLNEVLVLATTEGFVVTDADITLRHDGLDAELLGTSVPLEWVRNELKSVTYHDLLLSTEGPRAVARVVIDV